MLHTGTMFAVMVYFWKQWRDTYFESIAAFKKFAGFVVLATALTGVIGEAIIKTIERTSFHGISHAEIEDLFSHLEFVAPALALAGVLILLAGIVERRKSNGSVTQTNDVVLGKRRLSGLSRDSAYRFADFRGRVPQSPRECFWAWRSHGRKFSVSLWLWS